MPAAPSVAGTTGRSRVPARRLRVDRVCCVGHAVSSAAPWPCRGGARPGRRTASTHDATRQSAAPGRQPLGTVGAPAPTHASRCGDRADPLVGRGQRDPDVAGAGRAVEVPRRDQDSALGEPVDVSQHGSSRVAHRYSPASECVDAEARRPAARPRSTVAARPVALALDRDVVVVAQRRGHGRLHRAGHDHPGVLADLPAGRRPAPGRRRRTRPGSRRGWTAWTASRPPAGPVVVAAADPGVEHARDVGSPSQPSSA